MNNRYYAMNPAQRRQFHIKLGVLSFGVNAVIGLLLVLIDLRLIPLLFFFIAITLTLIAPFFDVPAMVRKGKMTYHSLFLLSEQAKQGVRRIHGGTLFDYYFVLKNDMSGKERSAFVLAEYLKGLLHLAGHEDEHTLVQGTSYFLNERTASKVGLKKAKTDRLQKLILLFNYFNIMATLSLAKRSLHMPRMSKIRTYEGKIADIRAHEALIEAMIQRLQPGRNPEK